MFIFVYLDNHIGELLLKLALNTNQPINQSIPHSANDTVNNSFIFVYFSEIIA